VGPQRRCGEGPGVVVPGCTSPPHVVQISECCLATAVGVSDRMLGQPCLPHLSLPDKKGVRPNKKGVRPLFGERACRWGMPFVGGGTL